MNDNNSNSDNKMKEERAARYEEIFNSVESKAAAFDKLAYEYYLGNFGRMTKADLETLMFHLYIDQLLRVKGDNDFKIYSDYTLAKNLGIPQSKISSLKLKQQLQYPIEFNWRDALARVSKNVRYENGKLKLQIPDVNLYYEVKNAVEENGGFIDVSLTPKLLQLSPEYFLDLLEAISEGETRKKLKKQLRENLQKTIGDKQYLESEPIGKQLMNRTKGTAIWAVKTVAEAAIGETVTQGSALAIIITNVVQALSTVVKNQEATHV